MRIGRIEHVLKGRISKNFFYYLLIAGFCRVIDLGILYALTDWVGLFYLLSATLSFILAQSLNYYLNKTLNFGDKSRQIAKQLTMFMAVNAVGLGVSLGIMALLVEVFGWWYILARIVGMVIAMSFNYFMHKRYTFSKFN
jgi:putative flippase GtrA